jgi:hypothetical protein
MPAPIVREILRRLGVVEQKMGDHFTESGEIKADIAWLKKAYWVQAGAFLTFTATLVIAVMVYLLNH